MAKIDFYGGVDESGGNKVVWKKNDSLFLDFGMSFKTANQYFEFYNHALEMEY